MERRILVVEDDAAQRRVIAALFRAQGRVVSEADCAQVALDILDAEAGPWVVLLDIGLPGMGGLDLLSVMRGRGDDARVVMLTADGGVDTAVRAMQRGAADYLEKPVAMDRLRAVVARHAAMPAAPAPSGAFAGLVAGAPAMVAALDLARRVAPSRMPVLVTGPSGSGKERLARAIHETSGRTGAFVAVNCGALPESLIESLLFGHEKGAFTGADRAKPGRFREAEGGTLFLDEIGEMPLAAQVSLLRVVQEGEVDPLGGRGPVSVDVRLLAATNRDLGAEIAEGRFREDLYFRLAGVEIALPGLAERGEDISALAATHAAEAARREGRQFHGFGPGVAEWLAAQPWPGNVRELQNAVHRALVLSEGSEIRLADFRPAGPASEPVRPAPRARPSERGARRVRALAEVEAEAIADALILCSGQISETARRLGIGRSTLYRKMAQYQIAPFNEPREGREHEASQDLGGARRQQER
ncbi:sigma-54-dependent Fis family transcriptional regulator [Paroceanicella profunda]|uniref:DNA-binding transcriptional regulator NtrC n=1 Tax=Paroceanicella profunda TaxID=2579971 RepID=A0A5B8FW27_9RHOB|nr:sigma-54 dependent transcriptional regulator [Paroceanicella profunda]QDL93046.1 sigma-54-dependent Fis family transcriptional regulator [Paroceanicella profunda]